MWHRNVFYIFMKLSFIFLNFNFNYVPVWGDLYKCRAITRVQRGPWILWCWGYRTSDIVESADMVLGTELGSSTRAVLVLNWKTITPVPPSFFCFLTTSLLFFFIFKTGSHTVQNGFKSSMYSRIVMDLWPSCHLFQSSEVTGIHQYTWFFLPCWEGTQDFMDATQALYKPSYIPSLPILKENETLILALYLPLENILWEHKYFRQLQFYWTFL